MSDAPESAPIIGVQEAYRSGYRDGCADVARSFGYTVEYDEDKNRVTFPAVTVFILTVAFALVAVNFVLAHTQPSVREVPR